MVKNILCKDNMSINPVAPKFYINAFNGGQLSKYITSNGYYDLFSVANNDVCPIQKCNLFK